MRREAVMAFVKTGAPEKGDIIVDEEPAQVPDVQDDEEEKDDDTGKE